MKDNKGIIIGVVVVIVVAVAAAALAMGSDDGNKMESAPQQTSQTSSESDSTESKPEATPTTSVTIEDYKFGPANIQVKVGDTVTWTNQDGVKHDVVDDKESADGPKSELLAKGESYSFTFTKAGTYNYHCTPHPYMKGTVTVVE